MDPARGMIASHSTVCAMCKECYFETHVSDDGVIGSIVHSILVECNNAGVGLRLSVSKTHTLWRCNASVFGIIPMPPKQALIMITIVINTKFNFNLSPELRMEIRDGAY